MGLVKISDLPSAAVLTGAELIELSQGGFSRKGTSSLFAVLNLANVFTVFQTIRSAGGVNLRIENTGASINSYFGVDGSAGYAGTSSNHAFNLYTNNALRMAIGAAGNITIAAPSSGLALQVSGLGAANTLQLVSTGAASQLNSGWNVGLAGSQWNLYTSSTDSLSLGAAGSGAVNVFSGGSQRIAIAAAGNVTVNAPSSGTALTVTSASGAYASTLSSGGSALSAGYNIGLLSNAWNLHTTGTDPFVFGTISAATAALYTNSAQRILVGSAGNVTINAPSSGNSLLVNAAAAATGIAFSDGTVTGWAADFGATRHNFGTSSNHSSNWYSNNTQRVVLAAAGNVTINAPSSGVALTVNGSTQVDTGAVIWTIAEDGSGAYLDLSGSNNFRIYTGSAERIRVGNTGIVTINAPSSDTALILPAAATGYSSMRLPHGAAPSAPVNGDMWTTTAGLFVRINGATVGPLT